MKQGTGRNVHAGGKVEPRSTGITPGSVSRIGNQVVYVVPPKNTERGFNAPAPVASSTHKSGSQGRH